MAQTLDMLRDNLPRLGKTFKKTQLLDISSFIWCFDYQSCYDCGTNRQDPLTIQTFSLQNLREHGSPDRCNSDPGYGGQTPVLLHQPPLRLPLSLRGWKVHMGWWDTSGKVAKYNNLRIQKKFSIVQCTMCTFTY